MSSKPDGRSVRPTAVEWEGALEVILSATTDYPNAAGVQNKALDYLRGLNTHRIPKALQSSVTKVLTDT